TEKQRQEVARQIREQNEKNVEAAKNRLKVKAGDDASDSSKGGGRDGKTHRHDPRENPDTGAPDDVEERKERKKPDPNQTDPSDRARTLHKAHQKDPDAVRSTDKTDQDERTHNEREYMGREPPRPKDPPKDGGTSNDGGT